MPLLYTGLAPLLTLVVGHGCQLLHGILVVLMAGRARGLGRCQGHGGRAGKVTRLQEEKGMITAAVLGRSWGTVPIWDLEDLTGESGGTH